MNDIIPRRRSQQPVDLDEAAQINGDLERDIQHLLGSSRATRPAPAIPAPVIDHEDIGKLSAEAVLSQYDQAAKSVEELGNEIKDRIRKLEAAMIEANNDLKLIADASQKIMEKGKQVYLQIEEASGVSKDIRDTCAEFVRRVGA
jgi:hypothetical protein